MTKETKYLRQYGTDADYKPDNNPQWWVDKILTSCKTDTSDMKQFGRPRTKNFIGFVNQGAT